MRLTGQHPETWCQALIYKHFSTRSLILASQCTAHWLFSLHRLLARPLSRKRPSAREGGLLVLSYVLSSAHSCNLRFILCVCVCVCSSLVVGSSWRPVTNH